MDFTTTVTALNVLLSADVVQILTKNATSGNAYAACENGKCIHLVYACVTVPRILSQSIMHILAMLQYSTYKGHHMTNHHLLRMHTVLSLRIRNIKINRVVFLSMSGYHCVGSHRFRLFLASYSCTYQLQDEPADVGGGAGVDAWSTISFCPGWQKGVIWACFQSVKVHSCICRLDVSCMLDLVDDSWTAPCP